MRIYAVFRQMEWLDYYDLESENVGIFMTKEEAEDYKRFLEMTDPEIEDVMICEYETIEWRIGAWKDSEVFRW